MRITQQMLADSALTGMQKNLRRLSELQRQAVTTKRVNRPEDDPFAVEQGLGFRAKIKANEVARNNIDHSQDWLSATDRALGHTGDLIQRSKNLLLQGANDTLGLEERESLSVEIDQILEEMVAVSNTRHGDDHIFSGFNINSPAFLETRDPTGQITAVAPNGDISGQIVREVEPGADMVVNVPGDSVFSDIFTTLIDARDALTADPAVLTDITDRLDELKTQLDTVLDAQTAVGAKGRRLEASVQRMKDAEVGMHELLSKAEDADMPKVVSELNQQSFIYQAALNVNGQILRTSLLDFVR